jgi:ribonuclease HII
MTAAACTMRTAPSLTIERRLWRGGCTYVAGLDEAGRGALAGPIAVGVVLLPPQPHPSTNPKPWGPPRRLLQGVRDSKQMTPGQRDAAAERIRQYALAWSVGFASSEEIDSDGVVQAVRLAALRALEDLGLLPEYLLTDFRLELPELGISQSSLVRGDALCMSIAAASVLAKTARDKLMREMDIRVPGYGLAQHKGYGTRAHRLAIRRMGRSPVHRKTFSMGI